MIFQAKCSKIQEENIAPEHLFSNSNERVDIVQRQPLKKNTGTAHFYESTKQLLTRPTLEKSFNEQVELTNNLYEIAIEYKNNTKMVVNTAKNIDRELENVLNDNSGISVQPNHKPFSYTSKTVLNKKFTSNQRKQMKLPNGVVPFQTNIDDSAVDHAEKNENSPHIRNIVEMVNENNKLRDIDNLKRLHIAGGDSDAGAHEENDFVVDEHNNFDREKIASEKKNHKMVNDAAEEQHLYDKEIQPMKIKANDMNNPMRDNDDLHVINRAEIGDEDNRILLDGNKLKSEVNEDQGKAYPEELNYQAEDEDGKLSNNLLNNIYITNLLQSIQQCNNSTKPDKTAFHLNALSSDTHKKIYFVMLLFAVKSPLNTQTNFLKHSKPNLPWKIPVNMFDRVFRNFQMFI